VYISFIQDFRWIFLGIAVFWVTSLLVFSGRFLVLFQINFVRKSNNLTWNKIQKEKYLKESLFLKNLDILWNKPARCSKSFAVRVTKLEDLTVQVQNWAAGKSIV
jgi:hypothetical protein